MILCSFQRLHSCPDLVSFVVELKTILVSGRISRILMVVFFFFLLLLLLFFFFLKVDKHTRKNITQYQWIAKGVFTFSLYPVGTLFFFFSLTTHFHCAPQYRIKFNNNKKMLAPDAASVMSSTSVRYKALRLSGIDGSS